MIAIKGKSHSQQHHQYKHPIILILQWLVVFFQTVLLGTLSLFQHLFTQVSLAFNNTHHFVAKHVSLASLYEFIRLSLIANGLIPAGTHYYPTLPATDDELETCLEYVDLILPSNPVSKKGVDTTIWPLSPLLTGNNDLKRVPSNASLLYEVPVEDPGGLHKSQPDDSAPFQPADIDPPHPATPKIVLVNSDSNVSANDPPPNDSKPLASAFNSTLPPAQKELPQSKPSAAGSSKKKKTSKLTATDSALEPSALEKPAPAKRKTSKHSTSLPVNAFQSALTMAPKGPKSPKSPRNAKSRFDDALPPVVTTLVPGLVSSKKRDLSAPSKPSVTADSFVPTCPASHLAAAHNNGSKKQKKPLLSKKKFFEQAVTPQKPAMHKTSEESLQQVIEEKGFKLVKKKSKKKKSLSVDKNMEKSVSVVCSPVSIVPEDVSLKVNPIAKASAWKSKDKEVTPFSVRREPLLESDSQDISDIIDAALHNLSELSDNDNDADINRYSSPVSSSSSCPSPVSLKWSLDNRYFGYKNAVSSPVMGGAAELSSFHQQQPSPWISKPEDNFFSPYRHPQSGFYSKGFATSPVSQAVSPGPGYPPQSMMFLSPPQSPFMDGDLSLAGSSAPGAAVAAASSTKRSNNARVTNSTLMWSVPDHLRNHMRNL
ncbi:hypothetical protein D0Z00_003510 [Geotrichum galactomycetum]|uniref:Uncharacterized protein n=1 Tax=Geotrichum galactomycetum TaxID=27317 RepID=A0ACB6V158_9ASCO|nr:hypothetical protein D0Z00_003510 [Geotrichum candidum]